MTTHRWLWRFVAVLALAGAFALTACGDDDDNGDSTDTPVPPTSAATSAPLDGSITVFAAASLTDAFNDIGEAFTTEHPDASVTFNFAGSPALVTQLEQGASADVLATADERNMASALEKELVVDAGETFAQNKLAIIVPADNPANIAAPEDLANDGLKLVLAEASVPVGNYARQSLEKLSADAAYGADFGANVLANLVSEEPNVKAVVTKVQLGEADAGIVYVTDVTADVADEITLIEIPEKFNVIATYPIAVTADAGSPDIAAAFIDFVLSDAGQAILEEYGFVAADA
jgi:molybdate transport system substrate-binding protein